MTRRSLGRIGIAAAVVAALMIVAVVAARLWIGSERGRRTVERKVDRAVAEHVGGHVRVGHIAGTLVGGVTLDDVEWRDDAGRPALRARRVVARWSAARAIAKRPTIELRVESPILDLDRLAAGVELDEAARLLSEGRERIDALTLSALEIVDGTVQAGGHTLRGVALRGTARIDKPDGGRLGDRAELQLERATAQAELGGVPVAFAADGAVRWDRAAGTVAAEGLTVRAGGSSAVLGGTLAGDTIDLRLRALRIAPADLRRLSPRAEAPRTPLAGDARLHGPLDGAALDGELRPDRGRVRLAGTVDLRQRRAALRATLDDVEADYTPAVLAGTIRIRAAAAHDRLTLDWRADGHTFRRELDPNLPLSARRARAFAAVRPGGRFHGSGQLVARVADRAPSARMRFRLVVDDAGQAARLVAGPDLRATTAPLILDGDWRLRRHGAATLTLTR
jgi:hypothetical protein